MQPTEPDFVVVQALAKMVGIIPERVTALKRRWQIESHDRAGAPHLLLFGSQEAVCQLVAAAAGPEALQLVQQSTAAAIVTGADPESVRPLVTAWPQVKSATSSFRSLIVLRSIDRIPAGTLEALASLGTIDRAVLATRLAQPINQDELGLAAALTDIAETLKIVLVGHQAEEVGTEEAAELLAYAGVRAESIGFKGARYGGAVFWFPGRFRGVPGEIDALPTLFAVQDRDLGRSRDAALLVAFRKLVDEIDGRLVMAVPNSEALNASPIDIQSLVRQFGLHLEGLGREIEAMAEDGELKTSDEARALLKTRIGNWAHGMGLPGETLGLAEKFRPGAIASVMAARDDAVSSVALELKPLRRPVSARQSAVFRFLARHHYARIVVAIGLGVCAAMVAQILTPLLPLPTDSFLKPFFGPAVGALTGLAIYFVLSEPWVIGRGPAPETGSGSPSSPLKGWTPAKEHLLAAFSAHMRDEGPAAARKTLAELKRRFVDGSNP